jgi:hypothetical protein
VSKDYGKFYLKSLFNLHGVGLFKKILEEGKGGNVLFLVFT